ncbi:hypothetical protein BH10CYA1_BH10CYA1_63020 [soil metagenome]
MVCKLTEQISLQLRSAKDYIDERLDQMKLKAGFTKFFFGSRISSELNITDKPLVPDATLASMKTPSTQNEEFAPILTKLEAHEDALRTAKFSSRFSSKILSTLRARSR